MLSGGYFSEHLQHLHELRLLLQGKMSDKSKSIEIAIRLLTVGILLFWSLYIISPFILPLIWAAIIAVAVFPIYIKIENTLGGKVNLSASIFTSVMVLALIIPLWPISGSLIDYTDQLTSMLTEGNIYIPPPNEKVKEWPLIGDKVFELWRHSSENLGEVIDQYQDQLVSLSSAILGSAAGIGMAMLQFLFSTLIAGLLLAKRKRALHNLERLFVKLGGAHGADMIPLTGATIRSVAQGVLGVAAIQAVAAYLGLLLANVPGAEFWALGILVIAIVQLPPSILILPIIIYVFYHNSMTAAILFTVWMGAVSISDTFLKPIFLGKGVDVPMLVILIGALGGMIAFGIIGLFVGAVLLAIVYKLYLVWLNTAED